MDLKDPQFFEVFERKDKGCIDFVARPKGAEPEASQGNLSWDLNLDRAGW